MNMKYLIFSIAFALLSAGCSDKKDESQGQEQMGVSVRETRVKRMTKANDPKIPLDSSQILRYKDIDQSDSIMVGIRAFEAAEKEFVKRWSYTKDTELFMDIVGKICRESGTCASRLDSVEYKNDVAFILDSLMHNNLLDGAVEARIREMNGPCFGENYNKNKKKCDEESEERVKRKVIEELKKMRNDR